MNRKRTINILIASGAVLGLMLLSAGCATMYPVEPVKAGDKVAVNFTCRLPNNEVAATTDKAIDADPNAGKSSIYLSRKSEKPLIITAGPDEKIYGKPGQRGFEGEIVAQISEAVLGMKPGETRNIEVKAVRRKPQAGESMVLQMARIRTRPKQLKMTRDEYKMRTQKDPEAGQDYTIDPAIPGKVTSVSADQVVIRFIATPGATVKTPLGNGIIRKTDRNYEIVIDAKKGALVRAGGLVGRIVDVNDRMVTIDYSHPLGFEQLTCEVRVDRPEQVEVSTPQAE